MDRYFIRTNEQGRHEAVDRSTNKVVSPDCHMDMASLYAYLEASGRHDQAQELLGTICAGGKPITNMINSIAASFGLNTQGVPT